MFKIVSEPTFSRAVIVHVPIDGGHREESLKATFRVLPVEKVAGYDLGSEKGSRHFLTDAIVKLDELVDEAGQPIAYSEEVRDQALQVPYVRRALAASYNEAVSKARAGN